MFFRRHKTRTLSFEDRLTAARTAGFAVAQTAGASSGSRVSKNGCAAVVASGAEGVAVIGKPGLLIGDEVAYLVDGGYQKFFQLPDGRKLPALAPQLKAIHAFSEDLREALGLTSLYNQSLGSTSAAHLYDRVKDRDKGEPERPWEQKH